MPESVPIKPASTILLCRNAPKLEVFMVVRHHQIDFASGALVFPGGKVDDADSDSLAVQNSRGLDGHPQEEHPFLIASIREVFEECGVLLAREKGTDNLISASRLEELMHYQDKLVKDEMGVGDMCEAEELELACDMLSPFAHWITPDFMPKRFDTKFYICQAPSDHLAVHDGSESVDSVWLNPAQLLKEADEGKWTVIFPTRCNLELLAESDSVEAAIDASNSRPPCPVLPVVEKREEGNFLCIPKEAPYQVVEVKMEAGRAP